MSGTETVETIYYTADIVCIRDGDVLLIRRGWPPYEGCLALPGGHVDPGETAAEAAVRELAEETDVHVSAEDLTLLDVYDRPGRDPRGRYVSVAFLVEVNSRTTARPGTDARAVCWEPLDETDRAMAFDHGDMLAAARAELLSAGHLMKDAASGRRTEC